MRTGQFNHTKQVRCHICGTHPKSSPVAIKGLQYTVRRELHLRTFANLFLGGPGILRQDMLLGVDIVGEGTIDKLLGPKKGVTKEPTGRGTDGDSKVEDAEERPDWDNDNASNHHYARAFGGIGDASRLPLSTEVAPCKTSFGGNIRAALGKVAPGSQDLSASDTPIRRVSVHQRLPTAGRLVPVSPTREVLRTTSPPEAK